jgi:uncharacterized protein
MSRRFWLKSLPSLLLKLFTIGFLVVGLAVGYVKLIEPNWLDVTQVPVVIPNLPPAFAGYRIVQITDVHADQWMTTDRLSRIVDLINRQKPDLVALTGDYITKYPEKYAGNLMALQALKPKDQVVAVLGNHDAWSNPQLISQVLRGANVNVLANQVYTVQRGQATLAIGGVGDVWAKQDDLAQVIAQLPTSGSAVLLVHEPDFADTSAATGRFSLQLSGHSHGGQVVVPLMKPVLPPLGQKYPTGQYQVEAMTQYTSRGVGMASPRVRFNCRPEVTVLTLKLGAK